MESKKRMFGNWVIKISHTVRLSKINRLEAAPSLSAPINLIALHNTNFELRYYPMSPNLPFLFFSSSRSDCEVNDVIELAKDERLADKLYTETLRVLKLEAL